MMSSKDTPIEYKLLIKNEEKIDEQLEEDDDDIEDDDIIFEAFPVKSERSILNKILLFLFILLMISSLAWFVIDFTQRNDVNYRTFKLPNITMPEWRQWFNLTQENESDREFSEKLKTQIKKSKNLFDTEYKQFAKIDRQKFLLDSATCRLPNTPIFDAETKEIFESRVGQTYKCKESSQNAQIRRVNFTSVLFPPNTQCSAKEVIRSIPHETFDYKRKFDNLSGVFKFDSSVDAVEIQCGSNEPKVIPLLPVKQPQTGYFTSASAPNFNPRYNVLLFSIDSISRLNFHRHFPKSEKFFQKKSFQEFLGFHKVGMNTFPNLIPVVIGELSDRWHPKLWNKDHKLDALPLIFQKYRYSGYITSYLEDMTKFGLFNSYGKNGFYRAPTDYYLKPVSALMEDKLGFTEPCYQDRLETEIYYDYMLEMFEATRERNQTLLSMAHMATMTHNYVNHAGYLDVPVLNFFKRFFEKKFHENTVIFFYSDHSLRFGSTTKTKVAFYETKLPIYEVYIPDSFKLMDVNGQWMDAEQIRNILELNSRRLTSHLDTHATLMHILNRLPVMEEEFGQSLFTPIRANRTCEEAGIPIEFCACHPYEPYKNATDSKILAKKVVEHINELLKTYEKKCAKLELKKIDDITIRSDCVNAPEESRRIFSLTFTAVNGAAQFQTLVQESGSEILIPVDIDRLDKYSEQSKCVKNEDIERFCYCRDLLKNDNKNKK